MRSEKDTGSTEAGSCLVFREAREAQIPVGGIEKRTDDDFRCTDGGPDRSILENRRCDCDRNSKVEKKNWKSGVEGAGS